MWVADCVVADSPGGCVDVESRCVGENLLQPSGIVDTKNVVHLRLDGRASRPRMHAKVPCRRIIPDHHSAGYDSGPNF